MKWRSVTEHWWTTSVLGASANVNREGPAHHWSWSVIVKGATIACATGVAGFEAAKRQAERAIDKLYRLEVPAESSGPVVALSRWFLLTHTRHRRIASLGEKWCYAEAGAYIDGGRVFWVVRDAFDECGHVVAHSTQDGCASKADARRAATRAARRWLAS